VEINPCDDYTVWGQPCPASINIGKGATCTDQKKKHNAKYCRDIVRQQTGANHALPFLNQNA